ncbi:MAG: transposase [Verrucomicrobia bacterium]|nr:transposase [Verrucomicrobiota bacterium]
MLFLWCQWARRSRLAPFRKLAQTFRQYWQGIARSGRVARDARRATSAPPPGIA